MTTQPLEQHITVLEDSSFVLMARIRKHDGTYLLRADCSSITIEVYDTDGDTSVITATALVVNDVVFDTLQTSAVLWPVDTTGFNFKTTALKTYVPNAGKTYQILVRINPSTDTPILVSWLASTVKASGS